MGQKRKAQVLEISSETPKKKVKADGAQKNESKALKLNVSKKKLSKKSSKKKSGAKGSTAKKVSSELK